MSEDRNKPLAQEGYELMGAAADHATTGGLPDQLRADWQTGMETIRFV